MNQLLYYDLLSPYAISILNIPMIPSLLTRQTMNFCSGTYKLIMIRHGQSIWNKEKRWAGWTDVPLSAVGIQEAKGCAQLLKTQQIEFDLAYTSMLGRAMRTASQILADLNLQEIPVHNQWRLNQKHYGSLQGCSKVEINQKYGSEAVNQWRRSLNVRPPPLDRSHPTHPIHSQVYKHVEPTLLPDSECQLDIINRVKPLWENHISQHISAGKKLLIVAHGSSLRALTCIMNPSITEQELKNLNYPNATPIILTLDRSLKIVKQEYLGNQGEILLKMKKIKEQAQKKEQ